MEVCCLDCCGYRSVCETGLVGNAPVLIDGQRGDWLWNNEVLRETYDTVPLWMSQWKE